MFIGWDKTMLLELRRINVPPGQRVILQDISWQEFETILDELGDHRGSRLAYDNGLLEIMMPLPEHEDDKEIIGDLIKALLEELDIEFRSLGSTTFKRPTTQGLEPDQCFYIQNEATIRGKKRIDLTVDPPPDLAIEIDVTSRSHPSIYEALQVPELWRFDQGNLQINRLNFGKYQEVLESPNFPGLDLKQVIPHYLKESKTLGRNKVLKAFRQWVREQIQSS
ncbi:MAG: Uma2 family endonuclease [Leptolyngbya sp. IPPAS B-1204]